MANMTAAEADQARLDAWRNWLLDRTGTSVSWTTLEAIATALTDAGLHVPGDAPVDGPGDDQPSNEPGLIELDLAQSMLCEMASAAKHHGVTIDLRITPDTT